MKTEFLKTIYLLITLLKTILSDIQLYNTGVQPKSLTLPDNTIATFITSGYFHSKANGDLLSYTACTNFYSLSKLVEFPDGNFIAYNGFKINYFSEAMALISSANYPCLTLLGNICMFSADVINNDIYLLSGIIDGFMTLTIFDKSIALDHVKYKETYNTITVFKNNHCAGRVNEGFICVFIENVAKRFLTVLVTDKIAKEVIKVQTQTKDGDRVILKRTYADTFLICFLNQDTDAYCCIYDDNALTLTKPTLIARTGNYDEDKMQIGILSAREMLFVYASNTGKGEICIQKLTNQGLPKGVIVKALIQIEYSQISTINYLIFPNRAHGIVYGLPSSVFLKEINMPYCFDYCDSVGSFDSTNIDLTLYVPLSSKIKFTSLPSFLAGKISLRKSSVNTNAVYQSFEFEFSTFSIQAIASAKYLVINEFGESSECSINIFVGSKGNCKCPENTYTFYDQCLSTCPDYTYQDSYHNVCVNCASNGQFLYNGQCMERAAAPENTYVTDRTYNKLEDCASFCRTCSGKADKCIKCVPFDLNCPISCGPGTFYALALGDCSPCYDTCATCTEEGAAGNHKCATCKKGYEVYPATPNQCLKTCSPTSSWYLDDNSQYNCIYTSLCPSNRPILITQTYQCVESCSKTSTCVHCQMTNYILKRYKNSCVKDCPSDTLPNEKLYTCDAIPNIEIDITDKPMEDTLDNLNNSITSTNPNITIIKGDNYTVEIYDSTSKGGNLALSKVDFGQCEKIIRKQYNIPDDEILIFVKFDLDRRNQNTDQVEYQVRDSTGNLLDLKYCENETVDITYQIKNSSIIDVETAKKYEKLGIDIYNSEDPFFTDICFPFSTDSGTDIILRDRLKDIYQNISVCEESCTYKKVNLDNMTVTCSCQVKTEVKTEVNLNSFSQSIADVFTNSNFMVVTCYNLVFDSSIIVGNFGFWFCLVMIIFHLPNWLYYFVLGVTPITKYFSQIPNKSPPPKKDIDYIDRIISEGNLESKSINRDLDDDYKLQQFKKSQVLLSQSHSIININTTSKLNLNDNTPFNNNNNKKSLFTLTKRSETNMNHKRNNSNSNHYEHSEYYDHKKPEPKKSRNTANTNEFEINNGTQSSNGLNQSKRSSNANVNIIQYKTSKINETDNIDLDLRENSFDLDFDQPSIYNNIQEVHQSRYSPKSRPKNNSAALNYSTYSNYINTYQKNEDSNMSESARSKVNHVKDKEYCTTSGNIWSKDILKSNYPTHNFNSNANTFNHSSTSTKDRRKSNNKVFDEKEVAKKKITTSKFLPKNNKNYTNNNTSNNTNTNNISNKNGLTTNTAMTITTMNDSHYNSNGPFNTNASEKFKGKRKEPSKEILDDFDLVDAQIYDKRSFWLLLWICLKAKHPILSTFVLQYHFSLRSIIIINFVFGNIMDFAFNAFFYTDELISNRYNHDGKLGFLFDLQNNIVISIASFVVSLVISFLLNLLSTSDAKLEIVFNSQKTAKHSKLLLKKVIRCLKIKLFFFLLLELLFTLFFWYYITAFCAVYQSSQWSWLSGGFTSLVLGLLFPIPIALGIILIRKLAIYKRKNCLFKFTLWVYKL